MGQVTLWNQATRLLLSLASTSYRANQHAHFHLFLTFWFLSKLSWTSLTWSSLSSHSHLVSNCDRRSLYSVTDSAGRLLMTKFTFALTFLNFCDWMGISLACFYSEGGREREG